MTSKPDVTELPQLSVAVYSIDVLPTGKALPDGRPVVWLTLTPPLGQFELAVGAGQIAVAVAPPGVVARFKLEIV